MKKHRYCETYKFEELTSPTEANEKFAEFLGRLFYRMGYFMQISYSDKGRERTFMAEWEDLERE